MSYVGCRPAMLGNEHRGLVGVPYNKSLERTPKDVTQFAFANCAPSLWATQLNR